MNTFGEELKRIAEEQGFRTQKALAEAAKVSQQTVAALYLNKSPNVSAVILYKLCSALSVPCDHFEPFLRDGEAQASAPPDPEPPEPKGKRPTD